MNNTHRILHASDNDFCCGIDSYEPEDILTV